MLNNYLLVHTDDTSYFPVAQAVHADDPEPLHSLQLASHAAN